MGGEGVTGQASHLPLPPPFLFLLHFTLISVLPSSTPHPRSTSKLHTAVEPCQRGTRLPPSPPDELAITPTPHSPSAAQASHPRQCRQCVCSPRRPRARGSCARRMPGVSPALRWMFVPTFSPPSFLFPHPSSSSSPCSSFHPLHHLPLPRLPECQQQSILCAPHLPSIPLYVPSPSIADLRPLRQQLTCSVPVTVRSPRSLTNTRLKSVLPSTSLQPQPNSWRVGLAALARSRSLRLATLAMLAAALHSRSLRLRSDSLAQLELDDIKRLGDGSADRVVHCCWCGG